MRPPAHLRRCGARTVTTARAVSRTEAVWGTEVLNAGNRPRSVELRSYSQCYVDIGVGTVSNLYCISRVHLIVSLHLSLSGYFHKSHFLKFNASRDRGQVIHLFSEEAKQLLHPVTGLREAERSTTSM